MTHHTAIIRIIVLALALLATGPIHGAVEDAADPTLQVIVHQDVPAKDSALTYEAVQDIFLGRKRAWSNGKPIIVGFIPGNLHAAFCQTYLEMSAKKFERHWKGLVARTGQAPPRRVKSQQDMTVFIANYPGSIGYLVP